VRKRIGTSPRKRRVADEEGELPEEATWSVEVDVAVFGDREGKLADLLDGSIGEASMFHATFGYYAQGVVEDTAVLPARDGRRIGSSAGPWSRPGSCRGTSFASASLRQPE
jgi:hypothetical protein